MPYNTNSRLILQFDGAPYAKDTSEHDRACTLVNNTGNQYIESGDSPHGAGTGNSLYCGGGGGNFDEIYIDAPSFVFANPSTSTKLFSIWYKVDWDHPDSSSGLFNYSEADGDVRINTESNGRTTLISTNGGVFIAQSATSSANEYGTGWHHIYVYINGTNVKIGRDGAEVANATHTSNIWGSGASVYGMAFGHTQGYWGHKGHLDSIEILENDNTVWTGGSYTVPGKPSNYLAPGTPVDVNLTGQTLNTFAYGTLGVSRPVYVDDLAGQSFQFFQPQKLVPRVSPSVFRKLFGSQPAKRLRADLLLERTDGRSAAQFLANEFWQVPPAPSSNLSVSLAGQSFAFSYGSIATSTTGPVNVSLTGQQYSYAQGAIGKNNAVAVVGQSYSFAQGSAAASKAIAVSGQSFSYSQGSIVAGVGVTQAVSGQSYSYSQGTLAASQAATYNSNTRLQQRYNESNGSTTTEDSSLFDRTSTFYGPAEISSTSVKFGAGSLSLGAPSGTKAHSYVSIDSPAGLLSQSTSSAKRFDFWFRRKSSDSSAQCLLSVHLQNSDELSIYHNTTSQLTVQYAEGFGGTATSANGSFTNPFPYANWNHIRVLVYGSVITVAVNGSQIATVTRSGGTDIWRASDVDEILLGSWPTANAAHTSFYACGYMDSLVITEGDTSWTGGSYVVPTAEPEDPPVGGGITGDSANTIEDVTSTGTGQLGRMAENNTTTEDVTTSGVIVTERFATASNTADDVTTEGVIALGTVLWAEAQNTLETISSETLAIRQETRFLTGANAVEDITSTGSGYIWANIRGANTTEAVTSTGTGNNVAEDEQLFGVAANTTGAVTSTGTGELPITGSGANTTSVISAGEIFTGAILSGANALDSVTSIGTGFVGSRVGQGANTIGEITSSGSGVLYILGEAASSTFVASVGYAELLIQGEGSNTLDDVKTGFPAGYFDHYDMAFVKTQESRAWVR